MPFSKINFITPVSSADKVLRLCNTNGVLMYLVKESSSTVKQQANYLYIKQSAESNPITLDFGDTQEAVEALVLLRDALSLLGENTGVDNAGNSGSGWTNKGTTTVVEPGCENPSRSVLMTDIWTESNSIPNTAPGSTSGVVQKFVDLPMDYVGGTSYNSASFVDIIPPDYGDGSSYAIVLKTASGAIIPPQLYTVDRDCGKVTVSNFLGQSGLLVSQAAPPKVSFYKYVGSKGVFIFPPPPNPGGKLSTDLKNEAPVVTTMDGQLTGVSGLLHDPVGVVMVEVNGLAAFVGNGCTNTTFYTPTWDCIMVSDTIGIASNTGTTITLSTPSSVTAGQYVIVRHNSGNSIDCFLVSSASPTVITLSGTVTGTVSALNVVKTYATLGQGDRIAWFGSYAGYQLDTGDRIVTKYLEEIL